MTILITGSSGFLGSRLLEWLRGRGHHVTGTARRPTGDQLPFDLGAPFNASLAAGFDAVIHAAHDFDSPSRTAAGTRALFDAVRRANPASRQWFISSYSARPDALSEYGQVKFALERIFLESQHGVLRPGLVIGAGGMFGRNLKLVRSAPLIPLLDGGRYEVPILSLADLLRCTTIVLEQNYSGAWNLFHPQIPTLREIVKSVRRATGRDALIVPVPAASATAALRIARRVGLKLPFREDNLRSLRANQNRIHESDVSRLGVQPQSLEEAIAAVIYGGEARNR